MTRNCYKSLFMLLTLVCVLYSTAITAEELVIVNSQSSPDSLNRSELRSIFSMQQSQWLDGSSINVFVYDDRNPIHQSFCKKVLKIFPYQLRKNWDRLVYSGTGQAPQRVKNEKEMIRFVANTPGAIGYISTGGDTRDVKIVTVEPR